MQWNSEHFYLPQNGSERNFESFLLRGTAGIPSELAICSVFRGIFFLSEIANPSPERPERSDPYWLLKLRQMGNHGVPMKGVLLPWLIRWARRAVKKYFYPDLAALVSPVQNIFFPHLTLFRFNCPHLGRQSCRVACLFISVSGIVVLKIVAV
jgi:hypothetical protein